MNIDGVDVKMVHDLLWCERYDACAARFRIAHNNIAYLSLSAYCARTPHFATTLRILFSL